MKNQCTFVLLFLMSLSLFSQEHPYINFFRKSIKQGKLLAPKTVNNKAFLMEEELTFGELYQNKIHDDIAYSMAIHPNQSLVATGSGKDQKVQVFDYEKKEIKYTFSKLNGGVRALTFSPDGNFLVAGTWSRALYVWNVKTGELIHQKTAHSKEIKALVVSNDEKYLATGSSDNQIIVWDFEEMTPIKTLKGHSNSVNELVFTQDNNFLISVADDKKIIVWDWKNETKLKELTAHSKGVTSIQIDEDNQFFLTGGDDKKVIKWDLKTFEKVNEKTLPYLNIHQLSIDKSGSYFIRCGKEYQIELYNYETFEEKKQLVISKRGILKCGFSYDNQYFLACNYNGEVLVYPVNLPYPYANVLLEKIQANPTLQTQYVHLEDTLLRLIENQVIQTLDYLTNNSTFPAQQQLEEALFQTEYLLSKRNSRTYQQYQKQLEIYLILVKEEKEKYSTALAYFQDEKQKNPQNLLAYFVISQIYEAQKEEEKQQQILKEALLIDKKWEVALLSLGNYYFKKGKIKEAEKYYDELMLAHPTKSIGYQKKAEIYLEVGDFKNTELYLKKAIQKDTTQSSVYFCLGNLAFERGLYEDALQNYQKSITKNPTFYEAHWKIASLQLHKYQHHLRLKSYLKDTEKILNKYPNAYLNAHIWWLKYQYLTDAEYNSYAKKERKSLLDSAFYYVQLGKGDKNELLKRAILEAQGKMIDASFFSSPILKYQFLVEKGLFTTVHEKELLAKIKEYPHQKDYYLILWTYYYQTDPKKFEKWYVQLKTQFPSSPWLFYEYIELVGQSDVKKIQSLINEGLKADNQFSFFYEIRANLKAQGTKRFDFPKEPQLPYDSIIIHQDYVLCFYAEKQVMCKNYLGKSLGGLMDFYVETQLLRSENYAQNRWSYYVNAIKSWTGKYGITLKNISPEGKKYGLTKEKPIVPPVFDTLFLLTNGAVIVESNGKKGLYHLDIGEILKPIYPTIHLEDKHCIFVQTAQQTWGVIHWNGEILVPFEYEKIRIKKIQNVNVLEAIKKGKSIYFNYSGEQIDPFEKDFSFTQYINGKVKSLVGYDEYADFADDYSLHQAVRFSSYEQDSIFCIALLGEINKMRLKENLPPFLFSKSLYLSANMHSKDMVNEKFYHQKSKIWYKETLENRISIVGGIGYDYDEILFKIPFEQDKTYKEYIEEIMKKQLQNETMKKQLTNTNFVYLSAGVSYDYEAKQFVIVYDLAKEIKEKNTNASTFKWTNAMYDDYTYQTFAVLPEIHQKIDVNNVNYPLLNAAIFYETNRQRALNGGTPYLHSPKLEEAAFMHSKDMIEHSFFDHTSPLEGKKTVGDRYHLVGAKTGGGWGENIHGRSSVHNYTYYEIAVYSLNGWMNSKGHRENILNEGFKFLGCAGYIDPEKNNFKTTQNFTYIDNTYKQPEKVVKQPKPITNKKKKK